MASSLSDRRFKIAFVVWWIVWAIDHYSALMIFGISKTEAITDSLVSNILLAGSCLLVSNNMRYYLPGKEKYWHVLIVSLGISGVWLLSVKYMLGYLFMDDAAYVLMLKNSLIIRYGISFLMTGCMATISLLWYTLKEQAQSDARKADAERLSKEAELFKLRQQLQPHFLFNSLNSISALTGSQPEKARHMIQQLSDFLRGTLKREEQQLSTLREELVHLQLYLDIEKVRFGYRMQTTIECSEEAREKKIPSLLLQPVVENAIKFGLYDTIGEVMITIKAESKNGLLEIKITNPFDPETAQPHYGTGFGLASIKRRLFLIYARHDLVQTSKENHEFLTTITIPQPHESINN